MLDQLRGRNLAHVGCTVGLTLGLLLGMVAAIAVLVVVQTDSAAGWATLAFFGVTFALGALGYLLGGRTSERLWGAGSRGD